MMAIKDQREKAGLSQQALAEKLGTDRTTVTKWETGSSMPNAAKIPIIAEILNCSISDLFVTEKEETA